MVPAFLLQNQHFVKSVCTGAEGSLSSSGAATSALNSISQSKIWKSS